MSTVTIGEDLPTVDLQQPACYGPSLDEVMDALKDAHHRGETDLLSDGVAPATLAEEFAVRPDAIDKRLILLAEEGRVEAVVGLAPDTRYRRRSFIPTDGGDA